MSVERGLWVVASMLAVWSFSALVATSQIDWAGVIGCYAAMIAAFAGRQRLRQLSDRAWRAINLAVIVAGVVYGFRDLGSTLVYLTVFLQLQKIIRYNHPRDYLWLFLISYFQVVLAAAITVDLTFFVMATGFIFLALVGMTLMTLERTRHLVIAQAAGVGSVGRPLPLALGNGGANGAASGPKPGGDGESIGRPEAVARRIRSGILSHDYIARSVLFCLIILLVAACLFMLVPRLAARKVFMRLRPFDPPMVTGFTDQVLVGPLGDARRDRTLVMRVWPDRKDWNHFSHGALRLRGLALDLFDGERWGPSQWARLQFRGIDELEPKYRFPFRMDSDPESVSMRFTIEQDMRQIKYLFSPPYAAKFTLDRRINARYLTELHGFLVSVPAYERMNYQVIAYPEPSLPKIQGFVGPPQALTPTSWLAGADDPGVLPESVRSRYTALPADHRLPRRQQIEALTRSIVAPAATAFERVRLLNRFFHANFQYGETRAAAGASNLEALGRFVLEERRGHCEQFASAMAIMCRLAGVPARVTSGYYSTEFNRYERFFYVRQSHSHTWVEAWLDGYGWMTVDPTPPSALAPGLSSLALLVLAREYWDSWTVRWRRYVVDYSLLDQWRFITRFRGVMRSLARLSRAARDLPGFSIGRWLESRWFGPSREPGALAAALPVLLLAGGAVGLVALVRLRGRLPLRRRRRRRAGCPVTFYAEILALLARAGWLRPPDRTPAEFALTLADADPDFAEFVPLTRLYYRVRFAAVALHPDERAQVARFVTQLRRRPALQ